MYDWDATPCLWHAVYELRIDAANVNATFLYIGATGIEDKPRCLASRLDEHQKALFHGTHFNKLVQKAFDQNPNSLQVTVLEGGVLMRTETRYIVTKDLQHPDNVIIKGQVCPRKVYLLNTDDVRSPLTEDRFNEILKGNF